MYYEIYIDVFFLINFMMDYLLLAAVCRMLSMEFKRRRVLLGALMGAVLTCLVIIIPTGGIVRLILCHLIVNSAMVMTGLGVKSARELMKALLILYGGGFLLGGIFSFFGQYIRTGSLFFLFAVVSYEVLEAVWAFFRQVHRQNGYTCEAQIETAGKRIRLQGLIDTGNRLKDPLSGQPVCIVEREAVLELLEKAKEQRQIGFRSVGNTNAKILLVRMESLTLWGKSKKQIRDVWIGISDTRISTDGTYRMLVNPDIF